MKTAEEIAQAIDILIQNRLNYYVVVSRMVIMPGRDMAQVENDLHNKVQQAQRDLLKALS